MICIGKLVIIFFGLTFIDIRIMHFNFRKPSSMEDWKNKEKKKKNRKDILMGHSCVCPFNLYMSILIFR